MRSSYDNLYVIYCLFIIVQQVFWLIISEIIIIFIQSSHQTQYRTEMRNFNSFKNIKNLFSSYRNNPNFQKLFKNPIALVLGINTALYVAWKIKGVSQVFLVKHFSYERFNIRNHRYYTMLTYAFSHYGFFSYLFNTIIMVTFGKNIINTHGNRVFWLLYLGGALSGAFCMQLFKPHNSIVIPEVGAGPAVSSLLTFYAMSNLHQTVFLFAFPVRMWVILAFVAVSALMDPSKKDFGGMLTGLLMYQLFKLRM